MKCSAMIGNLFSTRRWLGLEVGMSAMCSACGGSSKGSTFFLDASLSFLGIGFFARVGQYLS